MIPICINKEPPPVRQAPGRKSAGDVVNDFPCISGIFIHVALVFLFGAWYNKVVIPHTLHQQHREKAENMSNTKMSRNIVAAVALNKEP